MSDDDKRWDSNLKPVHQESDAAEGVPPDAAEQDAEGMEHHVSDITLAAFSRFVLAER